MIIEANGSTPASDTREPALIALARQGDADAFGALYAMHHRTVFRFVRRLVTNQHLAEDITGETFLRAWAKLETFTWQGRSIASWLLTIARNQVTDHFKSARRREFAVDDLLAFDDSDGLSAEDAVLASLDEDQVRTALTQLRPAQREVLVQRFLMERSLAETARAMDRSVGAVKTMQTRAVASMRGELGVAA
ncbi:sigma-70 family RNA polymerase sigma factor [Streptomyces sp. NPDC007084]|uniref:RNA polymerase sigma factor n=1 Tax=Streptomyces sp. NPDC007084 TaxID=3154313 RepID=UPI0034520060